MITEFKLGRIHASGATSVNNVVKWDGTDWTAGLITSTNISDFIEASQDAVGLMVDTNSLVYTDGTPLLAVKTQMSITSDGSGLKLVNDSATPGNSKLYGTDGAGVKGWFTIPAGADGNGIYSGSGTVSGSTVATLAGGALTFEYMGGIDAILIDDTVDSVIIKDGTSTYGLNITGSEAKLYGAGAGVSLKLDATKATINYPLFVDDLSLSIDPDAILDVSSNTKLFFPPRMTTTQRDAISTAGVNNGGILYNSTTHKHTGRQNGAWVEFASSAAGNGGIYGGSGTVAPSCVATLTVNSTLNFRYGTSPSNALIIDGTTNSEQLILTGRTSDKGGLTINNNSALLYAGSSGQGFNVTEGKTEITSRKSLLSKKVQFSGELTPSTFGVAQNDYNPAGWDDATHLRLETTVNDTQITGIVHGEGLGNFANAAGRIMYITNIGVANQIRFMANNAGSQAEYRFVTGFILTAGVTIQFIYDATATRWRQVV